MPLSLTMNSGIRSTNGLSGEQPRREQAAVGREVRRGCSAMWSLSCHRDFCSCLFIDGAVVSGSGTNVACP